MVVKEEMEKELENVTVVLVGGKGQSYRSRGRFSVRVKLTWEQCSGCL